MESPFDLSQTFLVSSGLLVPCTLPRPLVKSLMPTATMVPGPGGQFQSVFPHTNMKTLRLRIRITDAQGRKGA